MFRQYLVHATEAIIGTLLRHPDPSTEQLKELFTLACSALTKVRDDPDFITDVTLVIRHRDENFNTFRAAINDLEHFNKGFMEVERKMLINHGISETVARDLVEAGKRLRNTIRDWKDKADDILDDVSVLRDRSCNIARELGNIEQPQERRQTLKRTLRRAGYGTAGALIIGINAANDLMTLTLIGIALSGGFGAALIAPAIPPDE
jgi:hypothetical protein